MITSRPARGAWVEIRWTGGIIPTACRAPQGARGSKCLRRSPANRRTEVAPTKRGLKFGRRGTAQQNGRVAPANAWVKYAMHHIHSSRMPSRPPRARGVNPPAGPTIFREAVAPPQRRVELKMLSTQDNQGICPGRAPQSVELIPLSLADQQPAVSRPKILAG